MKRYAKPDWIFKLEDELVPADSFTFPTELIRDGSLSDKYFPRTRGILEGENYNPVVTYQVFQRNDGVLSGISEVAAMLKDAIGEDWGEVDVMALREGDNIEPWEPVMQITAPAQLVMNLETVYLGILKRGTAVASNMRKLVDAANGTPIFYMGARFDYYATQMTDGLAAFVGGASAVSTDAGGCLRNVAGQGTMPHAQIACFYGDTAEASAAADRQLPDDVDRVVLVDWENDVIGTTMRVVNDVFKSNIGSGKGKLFGVRFDTSGNMRDKSVPPRSKKLSCGVCAELVAMARTWFDHNELKDLKIIVSGGFNEDKIREFETMGVKVDMYGVGSSVLKNMHLYDFTSDIVRVDRDECSKVGRRCRPTDRMKHIT